MMQAIWENHERSHDSPEVSGFFCCLRRKVYWGGLRVQGGHNLKKLFPETPDACRKGYMSQGRLKLAAHSSLSEEMLRYRGHRHR